MIPPGSNEPLNLLAQHVHDRRWSIREFRKHYADTAATLGHKKLAVSESQAIRWLSGRTRRPQPVACRILERMFSCSIDDLFAATTTSTVTAHRPPDADRARSRTTVDHLLVHLTDTADGPPTTPRLDHNQERSGTDGLDPAWERQLPMVLRRSRDFLVLAEQPDLGPAGLDEVRDELRRLARAVTNEPMPTFMPDLLALQDLAFRLLESRRYPSRDLYFLCGVVSTLVASCCIRRGEPRTAIALSRTAFVCAEHAGHEPLKVVIRVIQAISAYWAGWTTEAERYCQLGAALPALPSVSGTVSAWLPAMDARVQAALGNADAAAQAIQRAADARDRVAPDDLDEIGGQLTFPLPSQLFCVADAYLWMPRMAADGEQAALEAITAFESAADDERAYGDEALSRAGLALIRARGGDADGTRDALRPVLDLPYDLRTDTVRQAASRVHGTLTTQAHSSPATSTRNLIAEIEHFIRIAPVPMLPG